MLTLYPAVALFLCLLALFSFGGLCCIILRELFMFSTFVELGFSHCPLSFSVPYLFIFGRAEYSFSKIITEKKQENSFFFLLETTSGSAWAQFGHVSILNFSCNSLFFHVIIFAEHFCCYSSDCH